MKPDEHKYVKSRILAYIEEKGGWVFQPAITLELEKIEQKNGAHDLSGPAYVE